MKVLHVLGIIVIAAFVLLLIVGFDNVLALFRSRVALALAIGPIVALFLWCLYKAFQPPPDRQLDDRAPRGKP